MNAFMEILIVWIIMYRAGQCDPRKTIVPTIIEDHHERIYKCKFNETVDCLWQKNGTTTKISPYKYVEGNGINTQDCSIVANINQPKLKVEECIGLIKSTIITKVIAISGGSTELDCSSQTKIHCSWKRNGNVVNFDNIKYKYTGEHNGNNATDCSFTIANTTAIDNGKWECLEKTTSETNSDATIIASYDLQWTPTSTAEPEAKTTPPNTDEQESVKSTVTPTSEKGRGKENRMVAYLSSACAVIVVLIGVIICLRKRQITNRRISKTYSDQQLDIENRAASDNEVADKDPENEEHTYGNISKGHATPSAFEYKQEQQPLTQQFCQPDADKRSTEIVYTEVVISLRNPVNSTNSLPISAIEKTTYATILPKTITEEIPDQ